MCLGQKFSKPTQMFSVSVLEIFLDTKNKFYMFSFSTLCFFFLLILVGSTNSGIYYMNKRKKMSVQTPFTKDKFGFRFISSQLSFLNITRFHVNFYVRLFSTNQNFCLFMSFREMVLSKTVFFSVFVYFNK